MLWTPPKTNWEIKPYVNGIYQGDWFNVADYTRIADAIRFLAYYGPIIYGGSVSITAMPDVTLNNFARPAEINLLEDNVYALTQSFYDPPTYTGKTTWVGNGATPDFDDFNRMGQACVDIYADMIAKVYFANFNPLGSTALVTADGYVFRVRSTEAPTEFDYGYVYETATIFEDYGYVNESSAEIIDYGGLV